MAIIVDETARTFEDMLFIATIAKPLPVHLGRGESLPTLVLPPWEDLANAWATGVLGILRTQSRLYSFYLIRTSPPTSAPPSGQYCT